MKPMTKTAMAMAIAMLVPMGASAQFGGLKKAANKVKKAATEKVKQATQSVTETTQSGAPAQQSNGSYRKVDNEGGYTNDGGMTVMGGSTSRDAEFRRVEKAGGWDKYLELDKTANGRVMYKYFEAPGYETSDDNICVRNAKEAVRNICQAIRYMKGEREFYGEYATQAYGDDKLNQAKKRIQRALKKEYDTDAPISKADADALNAELERVTQEYHAFLAAGKKPVTQEQRNAALDSYAKSVKAENYWLNELGDARDAKSFPDLEKYRKQVNDMVIKNYSPTKILGTFMPITGWTGVSVNSDPSLKGVYTSCVQLKFRTYYEKDGKYYVLESVFRQGMKYNDPVNAGNQPIKECWPGVVAPVEIPANVIQKYL